MTYYAKLNLTEEELQTAKGLADLHTGGSIDATFETIVKERLAKAKHEFDAEGSSEIQA